MRFQTTSYSRKGLLLASLFTTHHTLLFNNIQSRSIFVYSLSNSSNNTVIPNNGFNYRSQRTYSTTSTAFTSSSFHNSHKKCPNYRITSRTQTNKLSSTKKMSTKENDGTTTNNHIHDPNKLSLRIISYNVLSSHLASPSHFTKCDPKNLDPSTRIQKILFKLDEELKDSKNSNRVPIVCLQEVSHDWAAVLHVFFAERGYHFVTALYGKKFNGYMGIATAYPTEHFKSLQVDLCRLSDKRDGGWPRPPPIDKTHENDSISSSQSMLSNNIVSKLISSFIFKVRDIFKTRESIVKEEDPWDYSEYRQNMFIGIRLQKRSLQVDDDSIIMPSFWIGNYHMPCAFRTPAVMNIHAEMVSKRLQSLSLSTNDAYILAGDFNILPDSIHYTLLTEGKIPKEDPTYPPPKFDTEWITNIVGMRSAYSEMNGREPEFTNYAHIGSDENPFIGTLDYIFLSKRDDSTPGTERDWKVARVQSLPSIEDAKGPYPNDIEPSDHILISADLDY